MLRIAVPNKGTLSAPAARMLIEAGYRQRTDDRDLICRDEANDVEFFYLRPRDIATYVGRSNPHLKFSQCAQERNAPSDQPLRRSNSAIKHSQR